MENIKPLTLQEISEAAQKRITLISEEYPLNSSVIFHVVSGMSLRNSRNRRAYQVSGNRFAHSRNNPLWRHFKKITELLL